MFEETDSIECLTGPGDPTSLQGSQFPLGQKWNNSTKWLTAGEWGCPLDSCPSWPDDSWAADKRNKQKENMIQLFFSNG